MKKKRHDCRPKADGTVDCDYKDAKRKPMMSRLPTAALLATADVAALGYEKHGKRKCKKEQIEGVPWSVMYDATQRHLLAYWSGEDYDVDDGQLHLASAAFRILRLLEYRLKYGTYGKHDDRIKSERRKPNG